MGKSCKVFTLLVASVMFMNQWNPISSLFIPARASSEPPSLSSLGDGYAKGTAARPSYLHADEYHIVATDPVLNQIHQYSGKMLPQNSFGSFGQNASEFDNIGGLFLYQNRMYVCDTNNAKIQVLDFKGTVTNQFSTIQKDNFGKIPTDIVVYKEKLFVLSQEKGIISQYHFNGTFEGSLVGNSTENTKPVSLSADENFLYICMGKKGTTLVLGDDFEIKYSLQPTPSDPDIKPFSQAATSNSFEIYILDSSRKLIDVYDKKTGEWIRSMLLKDQIRPFDIVNSNNNLVVSDPESGSIAVFSREGKLLQSIDTRATKSNQLVLPGKIVKHATGFGIHDFGLNSIELFDDNGKHTGSISLQKVFPNATDEILFTMDENTLYLLSEDAKRLLTFSHTGGREEEILLSLPETILLNHPTDIDMDKDFLYICDDTIGQVLVFNKQGKYEHSIGSYGNETGKFLSPRYMAVSKNNVAVFDQQKETILLFDHQGLFMREIGGRGTEVGLFRGLVRPFMQENKLILADSGNHRIQIYDLTTKQFIAYGKPLSIRSTGSKWGEQDQLNIQANLGYFWFPSSVITMPDSFLISDTFNSRVQLVPYPLVGNTEIQIFPSRIDFGAISAEKAIQREMMLYSAMPFQSRGTITTDQPGISIQPTSFDHLPVIIRLTCQSDIQLDPAAFDSVIQIKTDNGFSLAVPITGNLQPDPDYSLITPAFFVATTDQDIRIPFQVETVNDFQERITFVVKNVPKNSYPTITPSYYDPLIKGTIDLTLSKTTNQYWEPGVYDILIEAVSYKTKRVKTSTIRVFLNFSSQEIKRKVLVELFTGIWCKNCTFTHKAINRFYEEMGNIDANFIEYYVFSTEDHPKPRLSSDESNARIRWYQYDQGIPSVYFDGVDSFKGVPWDDKESAIYDLYKAKIEIRKKEPSPLSISAFSKYEPIARTGTIAVNLRALQSLSKFKNPALYVALIESNIPYNATSGETMHHLIMRNFLISPDTPAKEISVPLFDKNGELMCSPSKDFSIELPFVLQDFYKDFDMHAVVFVQDQKSKKVLQSFAVPLKTNERENFTVTFHHPPVQIKPAGSEFRYSLSIGNQSQHTRFFRYQIESDLALGIAPIENQVEIPPYTSQSIEFIGKIPAQSPEETNFLLQWHITPVDLPTQTKIIQGKLILRKDPVPDFSLALAGPLPKSILSGEKLSIPLMISRNPVFDQPVGLSLKGEIELLDSYSFSHNQAIPDFNLTLDLVFKQKVFSKEAKFTISAESGNNKHTVPISIEVIKNPLYFPPEIILYSPADNTVTNQTSVKLIGKTDNASQLKINGQPVPLSEEGTFEWDISLRDGENRITLLAMNAAGLTNEVTLYVFSDTVPPKLEIQETNWETKEDHFTIVGKTEPIIQLLLDENITEKSLDGSFAIEIQLVVGMNEGLIQAIDQAGNKTDFIYHIKRFGIIQLTIGSFIMKANSKEQMLDHPPYIKSGRTMVPLRALSEVLNYDVSWIAERQEIQIVREAVMITLWINRSQISLTNLDTHQVTDKMIDAAPEIKSSRTFIPLRLVSEEFGVKVVWDSKTSSIEILY